nr:hypothetical protein [Deltaproteobacteria bacterium]
MSGAADPSWHARLAEVVRPGWRRAGALTIAAGLVVAYLSCATTPKSESIPPDAENPAPGTDPQPVVPDDDPAVVATPDEVPLLPVLNEAALTARVAAQRSLLGSNLFEDVRGQPVPWITPQDDLPEAPDGKSKASADDTLLDSLPGSSGLGGAGGTTTKTQRINGNALGLFVPIEGPAEAGAPLAQFYTALNALRDGQDTDGKVRVLVYGASHTDADVYPHYLRTYLQQRFGNGGHGFVHVAKPWRWYRHADYWVKGDKYWKTEHAQRRKGRQDGYYGLMGCSLAR